MQNLRDAWQRMSLVNRVILLTALLASGGAIALLVNWARTPSLSLLYSGLAPEEASRIVEKIRDAGTPYELRSGGTAVFVPEDKVYAMRLELAGQGLPAGDQRGYRILDEEKIGTSPFTQRLNFRRAIEGEIAKSIQALEGVAAARVHVVRPENSLFGGQEKVSSATVVLKLRPGWRLSPRNIAAVIHLVAGSVEGLKPEDVVVVDSAANLLSGNSRDGFSRGVGTFLDFKTQHEEYLAHKVEDMLTQVLGPGRATVRVSCLIDNSSATTTSEVFDPQAKVPTKEETKTKSASGAAAAETTAANSGTTKEETLSTDYAVGRTVKHETVVPGKITSVTVAAFVDLSAPASPTPTGAPADASAAGGAAAPNLKAADIETIIRNALGLKETDAIKVVETPFHRAPPSEASAAEEAGSDTRTFYLDIARHASLGVLVIGALVALKVVSGSRRKGGAMPAGALAVGQTAAVGALPMLGGAGEENPALLKSRITAALQENPEEVKRLFMAWAEGRQEGT